MLDPITSLLATCVNCNQPDSSVAQPVVAVCNAEQRSTQTATPHNALTNCISPPEATPESSRSDFQPPQPSAKAKQGQLNPQTQIAQLQPSSPESVALVNWSNSSTSSQSSPVLQLGSQGEAVTRLQIKLQQLKHYTGAIDGIYGAQTRASVMQFQRSRGLQADGVVRSTTWSALQTNARQPQSQKPASAVVGARATPQASNQNSNQAINQVSPSTPIQALQTAPVATPAPPQTQPTRGISVVPPQSPLTYIWILGWLIIYGSGWIFILKDAVKELSGFYFMLSTNEKQSQGSPSPVVLHRQKDNKATAVMVVQNAVTEPISEAKHQTAEQQPERQTEIRTEHNATSQVEAHPESTASQTQIATRTTQAVAAPVQALSASQPVSVFFLSAANAATNGHSRHVSDNSSGNSLSNHSNHRSNSSIKTEKFALDDPWFQETPEVSMQVLDIVWADDGQVQPIQNVFVVAPRPTVTNRRRVKKVTPIIYDVKSIRQSAKTG